MDLNEKLKNYLDEEENLDEKKGNKVEKLNVKGPPYDFKDFDAITKYYDKYDISIAKSDFKWIGNRTKDILTFSKNMMENVQNQSVTGTIAAIRTIQSLLDDITESIVDKAEKRAKKSLK